MKLTVDNLGRIEHADLDIRPLTVFMGPNATNKTWTAYALHFALREFAWMLPHAAVAQQSARGTRPGIEARLALPDRMAAEPVLEPFLAAFRAAESAGKDTVVELARLELPTFAGTTRVTIPDSVLALIVGSASAVARDARVQIAVPRKEFRETGPDALRLLHSPAARSLTAEFGQIVLSRTLAPNETLESAVEILVSSFLMRRGPNALVLPAEREGLLLLPLAAPMEASLSPALSDYIGLVARAGTMRRCAEADMPPAMRRFADRFFGGRLALDGTGAAARLLLDLPDRRRLDLPATASLVRASAGLWLYGSLAVRGKGDFLVIDELEMNAHPEAQLGLVELVAALVNEGVQVLFTTHSPYVVDHLNNLLEASKAPAERRSELASKFVLGLPEAFLSPDKVEVYSFEETSPGGSVQVRSVVDREQGLATWETFGRVTNRIGRLFNEVSTVAGTDA